MTNIKSVCVYCGSSSRVDQAYKDAAVELGKALAANKWDLVYGGGRVGLMGLVPCLGFSQRSVNLATSE